MPDLLGQSGVDGPDLGRDLLAELVDLLLAEALLRHLLQDLARQLQDADHLRTVFANRYSVKKEA
jgi:hypothetical protein